MKLSTGSKIALAIVVAAGVGVALASLRLYRYLQTEPGREMLRAARLGAQNADGPGARELRAIGCEQTVHLTFRELIETARTRHSQTTLDLAENTAVGSAPVVICQDLVGELVSCERAAATYADGAAPGRPFVVSVVRMAESKCLSIASDAGEVIAPFRPDSFPLLDPEH